jgi:pimeloyl-ACP methyl ester carboxylesterase
VRSDPGVSFRWPRPSGLSPPLHPDRRGLPTLVLTVAFRLGHCRCPKSRSKAPRAKRLSSSQICSARSWELLKRTIVASLVAVRRFRSWDRTELAYQVVGSGPPLVCIPGGPGQAVEYLGELGGLSDHCTLILLDNRGTGASQAPRDPTTFRVDRLVEDVEALRDHLGLDQLDLFGHSASGGICLLYAAEHPQRLHRLVLVDPSLRVVGMQSDLGVDEVLARRAHEPWYADAFAALRAEAASPQELEWFRWLSAPLLYGRWNDAARKQAAAEPAQFAREAMEGFYAGFEEDPTLPKRLAALTVPVLLVVGEYDIWPTCTAVRKLANLLDNAELAVLPRAGHFPWVDDPEIFAATVHGFLARP